MDCPHHEHVASVIARLDRHTNGDHVQPYHIQHLRKDVDAVSKAVEELCETIAEMKQREAVESARRDNAVKIAVAAITAIGVLAQALITHFLK